MAQKKKNPEIKSDFISLKEAVKYCDYTQEYLSLRARQGKLKAVKFARNWLTKKEWIEEYVRDMEEYERNQRKQIEVKPRLEEESRFVEGTRISLPRISLPSKLKPALVLTLILLLLFSSIAFSKESFKNVLKLTISYIQETPKTITHVLKESKKSLASSLDSLNQSFINVAEVVKTTDHEDLKEPVPLFKEYFKWLGTNLKHQVLTFREGGKRFIKQIKEGILAFGQATKDLTLYIYNLTLRTSDLLVRGVTEGIPTFAKKLKKGWQFLVLEFQTQRKELKQFITRFWKRVPPKEPEKPILVEVTKEEFEKLKQEIERIKREGLPVKEITKEVEVSRITKVEPIKEITKEIKVLDDESLKRIRIALSQQETDVEKLKLAASLSYINFPPILSLRGATSVTILGTITTGTWNGDVITTTYGGSGADLSAGAQGGVVYMGASSIMGISAAGTSGYALISGGTGVPTWTSTPSWSTLTLSTSVTSPLLTNAGLLTIQTTATAGIDDIVFETAGTEKLRILENGDLTLAGNLLPSTASTYNLGSALLPFANLYADNLVATSTDVSGTKQETFTIDTDNTGGDLALIFGQTNDERLIWDATNNRFRFTDDLFIDDTLAVTTSLTSPLYTGTGAVTLSSGAGDLTLDSASGTVQLAAGDSLTVPGTITVQTTGSDLAGTVTVGTLVANTQINTGAGAGTIRIDATGNLSNIGDITFTGSPTLAIADLGSITFTDGANTLMQLADSGAFGNLTINTISPTTINAFALGGNIAGAGFNITGLGTLSAATLTDGFLSINAGAITGGTTAVFGTSVTSPLLTNAGLLTIQTTATAGADDIVFETGGTEKMRILENGDLSFEKGASDVTLTVTAPAAPRTYTIPDFGADVSFVGTNRTISATSPLSGGGDLSTNRTLTLAGLSSLGTGNYLVGVDSGATAWEYKNVVGTASEVDIAHSAGQIQIGLIDPLTVSKGGTGLTSLASGALLYGSGSSPINTLTIGTANKVLTSSGTIPQWSTNIAVGALPTGGNWDITSDLTIETDALFVGHADGSYPKRVGIGTASPSEKLTVAGGNIKVQGEEVLFEGFEGETFPPTNWTTGGNVSWARDTVTKYAGVASAASGTIADSESSWLDRDYTFSEAGIVSFYWKVSSEESYDFLVFCLDNDICTRSSDYTKRISGEVDWAQTSVSVSAGAHSFRWLYDKDAGTIGGSDKGWVDNVTFEVGGNLYVSNFVGIGTTMPGAKLTVNGSIEIVEASPIAFISNDASAANNVVNNTPSNDVTLIGTYTSSPEDMLIGSFDDSGWNFWGMRRTGSYTGEIGVFWDWGTTGGFRADGGTGIKIDDDYVDIYYYGDNIVDIEGGGIEINLERPYQHAATCSDSGGSLPAGTYYFKIVATDIGFGYSSSSNERSCTVTTGSTGSASLSWSGSIAASEYKVHKGTSSDGQDRYHTTTETSYTYTTDSGATSWPGGPSDYESGAVINLSNNGDIYFNVGNVGIGTKFRTDEPADKLTVVGGDFTLYDPSSLGSEKVTNGDFSTVPDTAWNWVGNWSHDTTNLEADHAASGAWEDLWQLVNVFEGGVYQLKFTVKNQTAGYFYLYFANENLGYHSGNGDHVREIRSDSTGSYSLKFKAHNTFVGSIDDVSVKIIKGGDIKITGKVGIGTTDTTPGYRLVVVDPAYPTLPIPAATIVALGSSTGLTTGVSIRGRGTITGGLADIGEYVKVMGSPDDYEQGDLLRIGPEAGKFSKTQAPYDSVLTGVISDAPGIVAGGGQDDLSQHRIMALAGQTKVNVSLENGPIKIGDYLTSSNIPGVAMKATEPGKVIGLALEGFDGTITQCEKETIEKDEKGKTEEIENCQTIESETGKIFVFINPHWSLGSLAENGSLATSDNNQQLIDNNETSSETSEEQPTILDQFTLAIKNALKKLGLFIENGIVRIKELVVEKLKIGSQEEPTGITLYDEETGAPYCVKMKGGELISLPGECDSTSIDPELPQTGEGAGAGDNVSESQPETSEDQSEEESVPEEPPTEEQPTEELPTEEEVVTEEVVPEEPVQEEPVQEEPVGEEPVTEESAQPEVPTEPEVTPQPEPQPTVDQSEAETPTPEPEPEPSSEPTATIEPEPTP